MSDLSRLDRLEDDVIELRITNAKVIATIQHLSDTLENLDDTVGKLRDAMNKGRGALVVVVGVATALGGAIGAGVDLLIRH